ncbi:hypothetical protein GCM10008967_09990 [Bacillus carboniphilus]|uniref:DUF1468 domain-containing protein n=1 Tax=Bacillus carboniphilus TaxID=86663 RepID=A0ABN0VZV0_9BACI
MTLANRIIGTLLVILSAYVWFTANAFPESIGVGPGADFFPKLSAASLAILSIMLILKKEKSDESIFSVSGSSAWKFVIGFITMIVFVILVEIIGFTVAATLFGISWLWLMGIRKLVKLFLIPILVSLLITLVFEQLLNVPIPHGIIY